VTNKAAANRYARALLDVGIAERADLEQIEGQLTEFAALLTQYPALGKVLLNPAVPVQRKHATVKELTDRAATGPILTKLLALLADRDRLVILPDLVASYREKLAAYRKVVHAEVTTAVPLAADRVAEIQRRLAQATGQTVTVQARVDPSIIGGIVAKLGSVVYDASVTRQLEKMRERLVER
jgi:F-type H+-transporting ATPase subunit delta